MWFVLPSNFGRYDVSNRLVVVIYTTNDIEAGIRQIRKVIKTKGAFPNEHAALTVIYLTLINAQKK